MANAQTTRTRTKKNQMQRERLQVLLDGSEEQMADELAKHYGLYYGGKPNRGAAVRMALRQHHADKMVRRKKG